jgi:SAM-dependent methyltransferase
MWRQACARRRHLSDWWPVPTATNETERRARLSEGCSHPAIYAAVAAALSAVHRGGGSLVDVGCGSGALWHVLGPAFVRYIGVDIVRYDGFPLDAEFVTGNLDNGRLPLADDCADVVASVETIEHLENPRAFMRQLARVVKPGGTVIVSTPNQLTKPVEQADVGRQKPVQCFSGSTGALSSAPYRSAGNRFAPNRTRMWISRARDPLREFRENPIYSDQLADGCGQALQRQCHPGSP